MKILLTTDPEIPVPPVLYGGAERLASDLIDEYKELGHDVYLVANANSRKKNTNGFYPWRVDSSVGFRNIIKNALQLRSVFNEVKPDIVHCFSRLLYIYPALFTTKAIFVKRYGRFISKRAILLASRVAGKRLTLVSAAGHMLNHLDNRNIWEIIYNFVDTDFYQDSNEPKTGLLFLGRIEDIKGVHEAILVANHLGERLTIAGNIEPEHQNYFKSEVKPYLSNTIKYIGPVDNFSKLKLFQSSKALLFPIKWEEPFGIVMAESLSCGTPVIAFRRGSVPEVVQNGINGFVVDNVEGMIDAVKNVGLLNRKNTRNSATERFSRKIAALTYIQLFEKMIKLNRS